jgi:hypothetical protein
MPPVEQWPPWVFLAIWLPCFTGMWILIARLLALFGWDALARRYLANGDIAPDAVKHGSQSGAIGDSIFASVSYNNCLSVWLDQNYLYLRPTLIFRLFHPLLRIPLSDIRDIQPRRALWLTGYKLTLHPDVKRVTLYGRSGAAVLSALGGSGVTSSKARR